MQEWISNPNVYQKGTLAQFYDIQQFFPFVKQQNFKKINPIFYSVNIYKANLFYYYLALFSSSPYCFY